MGGHVVMPEYPLACAAKDVAPYRWCRDAV